MKTKIFGSKIRAQIETYHLRGTETERERSSSSNRGLQRKKLETVTLPVMQLTSPDRVKKKKQ